MVEGQVDVKFQNTMEEIKQYYTSDEGEQIFKEFAKKWIDKFQGESDVQAGENKLEYTQAYNEFTQVFQNKLHTILTKNNYTPEQFHQVLQKNLNSGDEGVEMFVYFTKAITEFASFVEMMVAYKKEIQDE